jgi:hypothetical protein
MTTDVPAKRGATLYRCSRGERTALKPSRWELPAGASVRDVCKADVGCGAKTLRCASVRECPLTLLAVSPEWRG